MVLSRIEIELDVAPVPFDRPRFRFGRGFNSKHYAAYKDLVKFSIRLRYRRPPIEGPLYVVTLFRLVKPKTVKREYPAVTPDLDNFVKGLYDCGNEILWNDDGQIVVSSAAKLYASRASIKIIVTEAKELCDVAPWCMPGAGEVK